MENIIIVAIIVAVIGFAIFYVRKEKKKGKKCIGCPYSSDGKCGGCSCGCGEEK